MSANSPTPFTYEDYKSLPESRDRYESPVGTDAAS